MARTIASSRSIVISCMSCLLFAFILALPAHAQFSSGFTGVVVEQSSAVVAGAQIRATNQETRVTRTATSNQSGDFRIPSLPGREDVLRSKSTRVVSRPGFRKT